MNIHRLVAFIGVDAAGNETGIVNCGTFGPKGDFTSMPLVMAGTGQRPEYLLACMRELAKQASQLGKHRVIEVEFARGEVRSEWTP